MNRALLGSIILGLFLGLGLWSSYAMSAFHEPLAEQLKEAATFAQEGAMEQAQEILGNAKKDWEKNWGKVAVLADHTPMDEIDGIFAKLEQYARAGDTANFCAGCGYLSSLIAAVAEAHTLSWRNLL